MWNSYVKPLSFFNALSLPKDAPVILSSAVPAHPFEDAYRRFRNGTRIPDWYANFSKNCEYIGAVAQALRARGHLVSIRAGHDPDSDIAFYSHSSHFVSTGGSFGKLMSSLAAARRLASKASSIVHAPVQSGANSAKSTLKKCKTAGCAHTPGQRLSSLVQNRR